MKRRKYLLIAAGIAVLAGVVWAGNFYWQNLRGIGPAVRPPAESPGTLPTPGGTEEPGAPAPPQNTTGLPIILPNGFFIRTFAKDLPGARVMLFDTFGNMWVSQTGQGAVSLLEIKDGTIMSQNAVFRGLRKPHGLALDPDDPFLLYIAEEHRVSRVRIYSEGGLEKIADLPSGDGHFTRTLGFGPDGRLYVSIGSSCNVCYENDDRRAKMFSMNKDGSDFREVARGLRNSVFFTWHPLTKELWATEMGRDLLGDDVPPDEINIIKAGGNYGWPVCYGKNVHDAQFDKNTYIRNPCMEPFEQASHIDLQAHSAPLGLAFVPQDKPSPLGMISRNEEKPKIFWPQEYWDDLFVAYHGSWNRSVPTGYKVVRMQLDEKGNYEGAEDFITGWFPAGGKGTSAAYGRPVDIIVQPHGIMYISDDKAGVIYRVDYGG